MDAIRYNTLLAYADDIIIIKESKAEIITSTLKLFESSQKKGIRFN